MSRKITDIIFDLDGTLIDSAPSILECFKLALEENGISSLVPMDSSLIGPPLLETLKLLTGHSDLQILNKLSSDFKAHYDSSGYKSTVVFLGVAELLKSISANGFDLHIATNKRLKPTTLILEYFELADYFKSIYALDSKNPSYTNKSEMLAGLIEDQGINNKSAVYVGDRAEDLTSALENDMKFIGASWGYRDSKLHARSDIILCGEVNLMPRYLNEGIV